MFFLVPGGPVVLSREIFLAISEGLRYVGKGEIVEGSFLKNHINQIDGF